MIALFERAVSFYAAFTNVNAYNQPGVEAGKKAASNFIALQQDLITYLSDKKNSTSLEELEEKFSSPDTLYLSKILRRLVAKGSLITEQKNSTTFYSLS